MYLVFTSKMFQVRLPYYLGLNSGQSVSIKGQQKDEVFQSQRYIHTFIACARLVTSRPYKFQSRIAKRAKRSVRF